MSIWSKFIGGLRKTEDGDRDSSPVQSPDFSRARYAFIDIEVGTDDHKIHDIGSVRNDGAVFHSHSKTDFFKFIESMDYLCGHNIVHHDIPYLFNGKKPPHVIVDTLYLSPLLFPLRPYHRLVKDYKLVNDQMNNPVNDCKNCEELLLDEIEAWNNLPETKRLIFTLLLKGQKEFDGFLRIVNADYSNVDVAGLIREVYSGKICENVNIYEVIEHSPAALAYVLALIDTDFTSVTPPWVLYNYPEVEHIMSSLCHTRCSDGCEYCNTRLNVHYNLKKLFGFDEFRTYEGEPLQEKAAKAAVEGKSVLAIFPTGGGKSLTFQLPALMASRTVHGLTVVISPLQSLMKDQVDNLVERGIEDAVTINGMLDPITRAMSIQRVHDGDASILYIAPEMLRSKTIEKILLARNVVRFVIDEAHCFSSWGQDFRVDYLYIGKFIREFQKKKKCSTPIPVSCFTATAKQKVIQDICDYFRQTLNLELEIFASKANRTNLQYSVIHVENEGEKYIRLRNLLSESDCPTIIYVSRTKRTISLANKLTRDGYPAIPFNGKMDPDKKIANQEAFMSDKVRIIVATSAFGMGVDKKDVGLVIHYDISDSLENYVQEAGRAGRDPSLNARCYVLYSDSDLDKHFILLNQTKLSISEIQQVWKAVKVLTKVRETVNCSALEIARKAGWDDSVSDIETRVRTAISALEQAGYLERGNNIPHVYATGIRVKNVDEARQRITSSILFGTDEIDNAVRVIKSLISQKYIAKAQNDDAESRVDYLADILGLHKRDVVSVVERMRQEGILADSKDMSAYLTDAGDSERKSNMLLERFARLEQYLLNNLPDGALRISCKQINDNAQSQGISTSKEKDIRTLLYFLSITGYIRKNEDAVHNIEIRRQSDMDATLRRYEKRLEICRFTIDWLYRKNPELTPEKSVQFSVVELFNDFKSGASSIFGTLDDIRLEDVEEALLYMSKIEALKLDGGFLVLYNAMNIRRVKDPKLRYKQEDYRALGEFYDLKIQQIHIVGEYANLMVRDYNAALQFVQDYFMMDYRKFISKYFKGDRLIEIQRNLTPQKYAQIFGQLSARQMEIISDTESHSIVVAAGPGSGKTRVLVHKLASLLLLEDVKHEQMLMLTFSRAAATEFKQRLMELVGNAAHFVEIKTFHSYCFDLLGKIGNLEDAKNVVIRAAEMIGQGDVEPNRIRKTVLVIDEAQDMGSAEFALVRALMNNNEDMRIIAVGDDDQNIYGFRGSDSKYLYQLSQAPGSRLIEMTENYRSSHHPVAFANNFVKKIGSRLKSLPIISIKQEDGYVEVIRYESKQMYIPLVSQLLRNGINGITGILTRTNEEASIIVALLKMHGVRSKLIQSMDGLRFWNIAEVRYFMKCIDQNVTSPNITDEVWENAKSATYRMYNGSSALDYVKCCLEKFELTNRTKYITDFKEYVFESSVEDFCEFDGNEVIVSTLHKAKGREFDTVYMMASDSTVKDVELLRCYYVGITRAKKNLYIHTISNCFDNLGADNYRCDQTEYSMPDEIVLQLTHKDIYLDFFKSRKSEILSLKGGDTLTFRDNYLLNPVTNRAVARLSNKMKETLIEWGEKGYRVHSATVRFIVAWKPKDAPKEEEETAILLCDLLLKR